MKSVTSQAHAGLGAAEARKAADKKAAAEASVPNSKEQYDAMIKMIQNITDIKAMTSEKEAWAKARLGKSSFAETEVVEEQGRHHVKSEAQRYANITKKMQHNETLELDGLSQMVQAMDKMARNATRGLDAYDEMKLEQEKRDLASGYEFNPEDYQASLLEVGEEKKKVDAKTKA